MSSRLRVVMTQRERTWLEFKKRQVYSRNSIWWNTGLRQTWRWNDWTISQLLLYFFINLQNLRFRKDAWMHFNCNNELEVSQTSSPRLFLLGILTNFKRGLDLLYWKKDFNNTYCFPFTKKHKISVSLHWLVESDGKTAWLVLLSSCKLCI